MLGRAGVGGGVGGGVGSGVGAGGRPEVPLVQLLLALCGVLTLENMKHTKGCASAGLARQCVYDAQRASLRHAVQHCCVVAMDDVLMRASWLA